MQKENKLYFENLDGLRFICFLLVFLHHSFHTEVSSILTDSSYIYLKKTIFTNGNLGVNFFFVLSGFLITYLLIQERSNSNTINIKNFWIRRILRIWPLYFFCVFFGFFIFPMIKTFMGIVPSETATFFSYLTFTNNFDLIRNGLPDSSILGVLWSIAVEEQFYFIWPIILSLIPIKNYSFAFMTIIISSLIFRWMNMDIMLHEYHTLSCIGDMAIGGIGAWLIWLYGNQYIVRMKRIEILILYLTVGFIFFFRKEFSSYSLFTAIFERIIIASIFLLVILEQNYAKNSFFKFKNFKFISYLGTISYGLYCLHFIGILVVINSMKILKIQQTFWHVVLTETFLSLSLTIIISHFSYKYFENYFLKLKNKFI